MGPLRWAFKKFRTLPSSFSQLISVSAQYYRAIAKLLEKLDNALKMFAAHANIKECVKMRLVHDKGEQRWFSN